MAETNNIKTTKIKYQRIFLLVILLGILYLGYLFIKPFFNEILVSAILVTIFYPLYFKLGVWFRGRMSLAAIVMCVLIVLILVVPLVNFGYLLAQESVAAYNTISAVVSNGGWEKIINSEILRNFWGLDKSIIDINKFILDSAAYLRDMLVSWVTGFIKGTTQFIVSLIIIIFTMFFMFRDGTTLLRRIMYLTPLSNKYDKLIWQKFRDVSYSTIVSTFVTAIVQGVVGAIGFMIIGLPAFFAGVAMGVFSLIPFIGTSIIWLPTSIYLMLTGSLWQGIFLLVWGLLFVSLVDNLVRPLLIKNKAQVHPMIIFFSIFGGVYFMGFWGILFGPLVVALAVTILHIYELEFSNVLD